MLSSMTVLPFIAFILALFFVREEDRVSRVFLSFAAAGATFIATMALGAVIRAMTPVAAIPVEFDRMKVVALSVSASVEGTFFLGSGSIEGHPYYFFYSETPDGGKKLSKLNAEKATLYEEDRKDAFVAKVDLYGWDSRGLLWNFFVPKSFWLDNKHWNSGYAIHVPKGSIKEEIRLDLPR